MLIEVYHLNNAGWGCERDGHVWDGSIWGRHAEEDRREHDLCGLVMIRFSLLWGGSRPLSPRGTSCHSPRVAQRDKTKQAGSKENEEISMERQKRKRQ